MDCLLYSLGMGQDEKRIVIECYRRHKALPKKIQDAPELHTGLGLFFDAFNELDTCRSYGMGIGPIPWSHIQDYAVMNDFTTEQADDLHFYVQKMDVAYRKHMASKDK